MNIVTIEKREMTIVTIILLALFLHSQKIRIPKIEIYFLFFQLLIELEWNTNCAKQQIYIKGSDCVHFHKNEW